MEESTHPFYRSVDLYRQIRLLLRSPQIRTLGHLGSLGCSDSCQCALLDPQLGHLGCLGSCVHYCPGWLKASPIQAQSKPTVTFTCMSALLTSQAKVIIRRAGFAFDRCSKPFPATSISLVKNIGNLNKVKLVQNATFSNDNIFRERTRIKSDIAKGQICFFFTLMFYL